MGISRKKAQEYADDLMERPRAALDLILRHTKSGLTLLHGRRAVTRCYPTKVGYAQAMAMSMALGVDTPIMGEQVRVIVPNGVFYRAIAISSLDLRIPQAHILLKRLLEEAEMARGVGRPIEG